MLRRETSIALTMLLAALLWAGCTMQVNRPSGDLELTRSGWDSLSVSLTVSDVSLLGWAEVMQPDSVSVLVYDAAYDTLYAGQPGAIPLPDARLGDREKLLIEACAHLASQSICEQGGMRASPKRVRAMHDIRYPEDISFQQGSYRVQYTIERQVFGEETWEEVNAGISPNGHLVAYVEGRSEASVRIPLGRQEGQFDLSTYENYDDFSYYLRSALYEAPTASVRFELHAGLDGATQRVAEQRHEVQQRTQERLKEEMHYFVEQAADQLIDRLGSYPDDHRAQVVVDRWEYDRLEGAFEADIEVRWHRNRRDRGRYVLRGRLAVDERGETPTFRPQQASRRVERQWRRLNSERVLDLEPMQTALQREEEQDQSLADAESMDLSASGMKP